MNLKLYLDDLRPCPQGFTLARTVEEAIDIYTNHPRGTERRILSLDHDLGGIDGIYTKTGYDFCKWLVEETFHNPFMPLPHVIYMHTSNPVGRDNMIQLLEHYLPETKVHRSPMPYDFFGDENLNSY